MNLSPRICIRKLYSKSAWKGVTAPGDEINMNAFPVVIPGQTLSIAGRISDKQAVSKVRYRESCSTFFRTIQQLRFSIHRRVSSIESPVCEIKAGSRPIPSSPDLYSTDACGSC